MGCSAEYQVTSRSGIRESRRRRRDTSESRAARMPARSVGLVVEGKTEGKAFKLLPKLLNDCPRLDGPAVVDGIGAEATPEQVARRVAKDVAFLQPDNDTVVVVVDRECRVV